jgi:hypothetical protein|eukprot:COSAG06_NODE_9897_length_1794_cov_1.759882_1_plen_80_part_00
MHHFTKTGSGQTQGKHSKRSSVWSGEREAAEQGLSRLEEDELTKLLQLLHKPPELRTDKELEWLERRWACGYRWFHVRR